MQRIAKQANVLAKAAGVPERIPDVSTIVQSYNPADSVSALTQQPPVAKERRVTFEAAHAEKAPPSPKGKGKTKRQHQQQFEGGKARSKKGKKGGKGKHQKKGSWGGKGNRKFEKGGKGKALPQS